MTEIQPEKDAKSEMTTVRDLADLPAGTVVTEKALAEFFSCCTTSIKRSVERDELPPPVKMFGKPCWTAGVILNHIEHRLKTAMEEAERERKRLAQFEP